MVKHSIVLSILIYLTSTPLLANISMRILISQANYENCNNKISTGILLAGGLTKNAESKMDWSALNGESLERTLYLASQIKMLDLNTIIISGGSGAKVKEADIMASLLTAIIRPHSINIVIDNSSKNTHDTLDFIKTNKVAASEHVYLITSDWHIPRVQMLYKKTIKTCPLSSGNSYIPFGFPGWFIPQKSAIVKFEKVWHELMGIVYAKFIYS